MISSLFKDLGTTPRSFENGDGSTYSDRVKVKTKQVSICMARSKLPGTCDNIKRIEGQ